VEKYGAVMQVSDDSTIKAHTLGMLDKRGYRHTLNICNTYYFSTAATDRRTLLNSTLSAFF
jgi:hypothetical protein